MFDFFWFEVILISLVILSLGYGFLKPLPAGTRLRTKKHLLPEDKIKFLYDLCYYDNSDAKISEMNIYDEVKEMLEKSKSFFVMDMFLFNTNQSDLRKHLPVTRELKDLLIEKKKENKDYKCCIITDPLNTFYGCYEPEIFKEMREAGIDIIETDIDQLRDRNYLYAAAWRICYFIFGRLNIEPNWIKDPTSKKPRFVRLSSILKGLNARANHRKVIIADEGDDVCAIITSANIHEASSWFTNTGVKIYGAPAFECLQNEEAIARFSHGELEIFTAFERRKRGNVAVQVLTEDQIFDPLYEDINRVGYGDTITIAMLFIADLKIVGALSKAAKRGAHVRFILDANLSSFDMKKRGFPNQIVAWILRARTKKKSVIKWWKNHKHQLHAKFMLIEKKDHSIVYSGSANYTIRNLRGYTLESNVRLEIPTETELHKTIKTFADRLLEEPLSCPLNTHRRRFPFYSLKKILFYIQKITGFTTY